MAARKKTAMILAFSLTLSLFLIGCRAEPGKEINMQSKSNNITKQNAKPVVLIMIDSLMDKTVRKAMKQGRVPALQFLIKHGQYFPHIVSSFPTMSVTIDSTLLTGVYADQHHVPGLVWYSDKEKRMIFYGNGAKEALKIDQLQVLMDSVYHLNHAHLNKNIKTIHEELAENGKNSASINAVVFRGKTEHTLQMPKSIADNTRLPESFTITGPKLFSLAALAQLDPKNARNTYVWKKYGMNDEFSAQDIAFLVQQGKLPDFTIAYFPENDTYHHRKGSTGLKGLEKADQALQDVLNAYGSWEKAIKNTTWIVTGDSAQSDVIDDRDVSVVDLRPIVNRYRIAKLNQPVRNDDQIVISANERMAYIYAIDPNLKLSEIVKLLQKEDKLDIIAVKQGKNVQITAGKSEKVFTYRQGGNYLDEYGQKWSLSGDPGLADISINKGRIDYGMYPDVLARLYGALHSHEGKYVVVTVKPGYELVGESSPTHIGGGSHGSLHEKDSLVPLIVTGTDSRPKTLRIVDMKHWILQLVNR